MIIPIPRVFIPFLRGSRHAKRSTHRSPRVHADRATGRDRHHRGPHRPLTAGCPSRREAARRSQCLNNLKQLALASQNYEQSFGSLPMGRNPASYYSTSGSFETYADGWGQFTALLQYTEQLPLYNAINISLGPYQLRNSSYPAVGVSFLWCPSDTGISGLKVQRPAGLFDGTPLTTAFTSYRGIMGTFMFFPNNSAILAAELGMFPDTGGPTWFNGSPGQGPVKLAMVTDGLSNTMMFGEAAHGKLNSTFPGPCGPAGGCSWATQGWWADSDFGDGSMSTFYPMNLQGADSTVLPGPCDPSGSIVGTSASSYHSGGCNFAFGDGSVHFIKNSVSCWNSLFIQRDVNCIPVIPPPQQAGIYQALSTRNSDELVAGQY